MCTYLHTNEVQIAEEDIPCWKVVEIIANDNGENFHVTPYTFTRLSKSVLLGKVPFKSNVTDHVYEFGKSMSMFNTWYAHEGFIHTYESLDRMMIDMEFRYLAGGVGTSENMSIDKRREFGCKARPLVIAMQIWKCVIPKGSDYLKGHSQRQCGSYVSDKIVFKEMVFETTLRDTGKMREGAYKELLNNKTK